MPASKDFQPPDDGIKVRNPYWEAQTWGFSAFQYADVCLQRKGSSNLKSGRMVEGQGKPGNRGTKPPALSLLNGRIPS
jgi:hypothetical protein